MHVPHCLADLEESFGLAGCARGNSTSSNVLNKGPSMDQGPGIPASHRLYRDSEGPEGMNVTVPQMVLLQSADRLWLEWYFKYHHTHTNNWYPKHMCVILRSLYFKDNKERVRALISQIIMHQDCFQKKFSAECECSLMVCMCDIIQKALENHYVQDCTWLKNIQLPFWRNQICQTYKFYSCLNTVKVRGGSLTLSFWRNSAVLKNRMFLVVSDVRRTTSSSVGKVFKRGAFRFL